MSGLTDNAWLNAMTFLNQYELQTLLHTHRMFGHEDKWRVLCIEHFGVKDLLKSGEKWTWRKFYFHLAEQEQLWYNMYRQLIEYKLKHGHCDVENWWISASDRSIASWACKQRLLFRKKNLSDKRIALLSSVGLDLHYYFSPSGCQHSPYL
jgi:hypothetical protein